MKRQEIHTAHRRRVAADAWLCLLHDKPATHLFDFLNTRNLIAQSSNIVQIILLNTGDRHQTSWQVQQVHYLSIGRVGYEGTEHVRHHTRD